MHESMFQNLKSVCDEDLNTDIPQVKVYAPHILVWGSAVPYMCSLYFVRFVHNLVVSKLWNVWSLHMLHQMYSKHVHVAFHFKIDICTETNYNQKLLPYCTQQPLQGFTSLWKVTSVSQLHASSRTGQLKYTITTLACCNNDWCCFILYLHNDWRCLVY